MRHRIAHRKLGRVTEHRISMLRNQAEALLRHEHIETTVPKAKELRPYVERIITIAKRGAAAESGAGAGSGRLLHARRLVLRDIPNREIVSKLFDTIAPRFAARPGGYTRLLRLGYRRGDSAEVAQVELVGSEFNPKAAQESGAKPAPAPKAKGVGGKLKAAAERLRGKKAARAAEGEASEEAAKKTKRAGGREGSKASKKAPGKKAR